MIKTFWEMEVWLNALLISVINITEWSASPSGRFIPEERCRSSGHFVGSQIEPKASLDAVAKRQSLTRPWSFSTHLLSVTALPHLYHQLFRNSMREIVS
jgi:hypothetical protein